MPPVGITGLAIVVLSLLWPLSGMAFEGALEANPNFPAQDCRLAIYDTKGSLVGMEDGLLHIQNAQQFDPLVCSGTITKKNEVTTAAHCYTNMNIDLKKLSTILICNDGEEIRIVNHPPIINKRYNRNTEEGDWAILKVDQDFESPPLPIVSSVKEARTLIAANLCWISGYGDLNFNSPTMGSHTAIKATLLDKEKRATLSSRLKTPIPTRGWLYDGFEHKANHGDSGAGLYCQLKQVGQRKLLGVVSGTLKDGSIMAIRISTLKN